MDETVDKLISEKDFIPGTKMRIISRGSLWEEMRFSHHLVRQVLFA